MVDDSGDDDPASVVTRPDTDARTVAARVAPRGDVTLTDPSPRPDEPATSRSGLPEVDASHYEIGGEIAHGGMGRIRQARDLRLGRDVAIKELLCWGAHRGARFEREALLTARLQHPAIVPVYEAGRWPSGEPFYAMKLVQGRSLKQVIAETEGFDARLALLPHAIAVADAMACAHDQGIVHRDLKPANVLVGRYGETVVIDWGLAKDLAAAAEEVAAESPSRASEPSLTRAGSVMGTPTYMAPEQARGEPVDARGDVYAIGAILYHLLSGVAPYVGDSSEAVVEKVAAAPPLPLAERERSIAPDLLAIVERAMARAPADRYPSARELAEDLRRFQTGQLVASHHYTRAELARRFARKHRLPLGVGAAAVIVLAGVGAISVHRVRAERDVAGEQRGVAEQQRTTALERADRLTIEHARQLVEHDPASALGLLAELSPGSSLLPAARVIASDARARGIPRVAEIDRSHDFTAMVVSADGTQIATATDGGTIQVWDAATLTNRVIGRHDRLAYVHAIDRERVVTSSYDFSVRIWSLASGTDPIVLQHPGPVRMLSVSADGRVIATACDDDKLRIWDVPTRTARLVFAYERPGGHSEGGLGGVALSRDGRTAAYQIRGQPPHVVDIATGTDRLEEPDLPALTFELAPDGSRLAIAGADGTLVVRDLHDGTQRVLGRVDKDPIEALAFSPDGRTIASVGGVVHAVSLWPASGGPPRNLGTADSSGRPTFSPDGQAVVVSGDHPTVWDLAAGQAMPLSVAGNVDLVAFARGGASVVGVQRSRLYAWPARTDERIVARVTAPARQIHVLDDGRLLIAGADGELRVGDATGRTIPGGLVGRAVLAPGGTALAMLGADGVVRIADQVGGTLQALDGPFTVGRRPAPADPAATWVVRSGHNTRVSAIVRRQSRQIREEHGWVAYAAFAPDGSTLAACHAEGGEIELWTVATGAHRIVDTGRADLEQLAFGRDGRTLLAASSDGRLVVVTVETGAVRALDGHAGPIEALAVATDGTTVASAGTDRVVRLWDLVTGTSRVGCVHAGAVGQLAFVPAQTQLVSAGDDGALCVWDLRTLSSRWFEGHDGYAVVALAVSPDGTTVATAASNGTLLLWDLATGEKRELHVSGAVAGDLAFARDGKRLVAAVSDGTVREWPDDLPRDEVGLHAWIATALR